MLPWKILVIKSSFVVIAKLCCKPAAATCGISDSTINVLCAVVVMCD